jgi:hypothetical protein
MYAPPLLFRLIVLSPCGDSLSKRSLKGREIYPKRFEIALAAFMPERISPSKPK